MQDMYNYKRRRDLELLGFILEQLWTKSVLQMNYQWSSFRLIQIWGRTFDSCPLTDPFDTRSEVVNYLSELLSPVGGTTVGPLLPSWGQIAANISQECIFSRLIVEVCITFSQPQQYSRAYEPWLPSFPPQTVAMYRSIPCTRTLPTLLWGRLSRLFQRVFLPICPFEAFYLCIRQTSLETTNKHCANLKRYPYPIITSLFTAQV